jgi:hypothetical protein
MSFPENALVHGVHPHETSRNEIAEIGDEELKQVCGGGGATDDGVGGGGLGENAVGGGGARDN